MKNLVASLIFLSVIMGNSVLAADESSLSKGSSAVDSHAQQIQTATSIGFNWPLGLSTVNDTVTIDYSHVMDGFNWPEGY